MLLKSNHHVNDFLLIMNGQALQHKNSFWPVGLEISQDLRQHEYVVLLAMAAREKYVPLLCCPNSSHSYLLFRSHLFNLNNNKIESSLAPNIQQLPHCLLNRNQETAYNQHIIHHKKILQSIILNYMENIKKYGEIKIQNNYKIS